MTSDQWCEVVWLTFMLSIAILFTAALVINWPIPLFFLAVFLVAYGIVRTGAWSMDDGSQKK